MPLIKVLSAIKWIIIFGAVAIFVYAVTYPSLTESKIELGMSKEQVISVIGDNHFSKTENLDNLCVRNSWMGCKSALASEAVSYISWNVGIDTVLVVGFNEKSEVIFTGYGDT